MCQRSQRCGLGGLWNGTLQWENDPAMLSLVFIFTGSFALKLINFKMSVKKNLESNIQNVKVQWKARKGGHMKRHME